MDAEKSAAQEFGRAASARVARPPRAAGHPSRHALGADADRRPRARSGAAAPDRAAGTGAVTGGGASVASEQNITPPYQSCSAAMVAVRTGGCLCEEIEMRGQDF